MQCSRERNKRRRNSLGAQGARLDGVVPVGKRHGGVNLLQRAFHGPIEGQVCREEHHTVVIAEILIRAHRKKANEKT